MNLVSVPGLASLNEEAEAKETFFFPKVIFFYNTNKT